MASDYRNRVWSRLAWFLVRRSFRLRLLPTSHIFRSRCRSAGRTATNIVAERLLPPVHPVVVRRHAAISPSVPQWLTHCPPPDAVERAWTSWRAAASAGLESRALQHAPSALRGASKGQPVVTVTAIRALATGIDKEALAVEAHPRAFGAGHRDRRWWWRRRWYRRCAALWGMSSCTRRAAKLLLMSLRAYHPLAQLHWPGGNKSFRHRCFPNRAAYASGYTW